METPINDVLREMAEDGFIELAEQSGRAVNQHADLVAAIRAVLECDQRTDCLAGNEHIRASLKACLENEERWSGTSTR